MMRRSLFLLVCCLVLAVPSSNAQVRKQYNVILRSNIGSDTLYDGTIVRIFGMATKLSAQPTLPAATLYCNEGDTLVLNALSISQGDHHTIHLHGMDADTRNDGDPATSFALGHMQDTTYTVVANHAGTYIYHCHSTDVIHVQMGMYGLIVVRPKNGDSTAWTGGPSYDRSFSWLTSELDRSWHDNIPKHDTVADTIHVPPYRPGYFLINGKSDYQLKSDSSIRLDEPGGHHVYLRLANIGFFNNRYIFPHALGATTIASDGRPLPSSIISDTIEVAPSERYGVMLTTQSGMYDSIAIQYVNMNSDSVWSTQHVIVNSTGSEVKESQRQAVSIRLYPNPGHGAVRVSGAIDGTEYEIFNELGERVRQGLLREGSIAIDHMHAGPYEVRINGLSLPLIVE